MTPDQITLRGRLVHLDPLEPSHVEDLWPEAADPRIWRAVAAGVETKDDLADWIDARLEAVQAGTALAFAQRQAETGRPVGATNLYDIDPHHRTMEIGHTWLVPSVWGTPVNAEAKLLLLTHAFEAMDALRVQIKADARNKRSQRAIEKLGAVREGVLRNAQTLPDGTPRDMVYYSIIDTEWPRIKALLEERLAEPTSSSGLLQSPRPTGAVVTQATGAPTHRSTGRLHRSSGFR